MPSSGAGVFFGGVIVHAVRVHAEPQGHVVVAEERAGAVEHVGRDGSVRCCAEEHACCYDKQEIFKLFIKLS